MYRDGSGSGVRRNCTLNPVLHAKFYADPTLLHPNHNYCTQSVSLSTIAHTAIYTKYLTKVLQRLANESLSGSSTRFCSVAVITPDSDHLISVFRQPRFDSGQDLKHSFFAFWVKGMVVGRCWDVVKSFFGLWCICATWRPQTRVYAIENIMP
jgi:hypothetical protein